MSDFNACDDFFKLVLTSHILSAAMTKLKMDGVDVEPTHWSITEGVNTWMLSDDQRKVIIRSISGEIIDSFTNIAFNGPKTSDKVTQYAMQVLA